MPHAVIAQITMAWTALSLTKNDERNIWLHRHIQVPQARLDRWRWRPSLSVHIFSNCRQRRCRRGSCSQWDTRLICPAECIEKNDIIKVFEVTDAVILGIFTARIIFKFIAAFDQPITFFYKRGKLDEGGIRLTLLSSLDRSCLEVVLCSPSFFAYFAFCES